MEQQRDPLSHVDPASAALLSPENARRYCAVPVSQKNGTLTVVVTDPADLNVTDSIKFVIPSIKDFRFVKADRPSILLKISEVYASGAPQMAGPALPELVAPSIDFRAEKY